MRHFSGKLAVATTVSVLLVASLFSGARPFLLPKAAAAYLGTRSLEMSDSRAGQTNVTYNVSYTITTPGTVGSVEIQFCSNSVFPTDPCVAPVGLDATGATLTSQSGVTAFGISSLSNANTIILSRAPAAAGAVLANAVFTGITNPTNAGDYFVRVITFPTNDASGASTDHGGIAFDINGPTNVTVTVPPYLLFCVGVTITGTDCSTAAGDFIDLGNFSTGSTSSGQSQMVAATNGQSGYSITANGTTLESGNNSIPALAANTTAQIGISQFGINLRANTKPSVGSNPSGVGVGSPTGNYNQPNSYRYNDGDTVVTNAVPDDLRKYTVSYIVNVGQSQPVGIYASTFTYVAMANF